mmetsp:Transcript_67453/g.161831  ORF Transcript_67453/g.161831 Transcript_67453/m.161831 type:complete len:168 (-) Transcript_67453:199-702(-)
MAVPLKPSVLWAQRKDSVFVTIDIKDARDLTVDLREVGLKFAASGADDGARYEFDLDFFAEIVCEASKWKNKRCPEFYLRKKAEETWPRLQKAGKLSWVKVDWKRWADSDEEDEKGGFDVDDMEGLDFSNVPADDDLESDDGDEILADLDEEIVVSTDDEAADEAKK